MNDMQFPMRKAINLRMIRSQRHKIDGFVKSPISALTFYEIIKIEGILGFAPFYSGERQESRQPI
jgi:hypothetical protein